MNTDEIVEKRTQLLNYFFNEEKEYSKIDILNKEYSALNFSPREEYIDAFLTNYDDVLTPIFDIKDDYPEVLIKGIVVDVDMKKNYCIVHLQNKGDNISVSVDSNVLNKYGDYLQKGHLLLVKGHTYNGKVYMHFLIDYNVSDSFVLENNYLNKSSEEFVDDLNLEQYHSLIGLVRQAKYFVSKNNKSCLRIEVHEQGQEKVYITCKNPNSSFPENITAGMLVSYTMSNKPPFINNLKEAQL